MPGSLQLLTLTLSSLLISSTNAARCGTMKYTQCTDTECSVGCTTVEYQPSDCGTGYLQQSVSYGGVATMCHQDQLRFQFYSDDTCTGSQSQDSQVYDFDLCKINDLGSAKLVPSGDQPQFYEITQAEYEERFNQRWTTDSESNVLGFGMNNKFVPPLHTPTYLLNELDRYGLVGHTLPWAPFLSEAFISALGDTNFSFFWYNSGDAAGQELYPDGINKYFDMYSWGGISRFLIYWVWYHACDLSRVFLFLPMNVWLGIFNNMSFDGIWKMLIPTIFTWFFHLRGERGWLLG